MAEVVEEEVHESHPGYDFAVDDGLLPRTNGPNLCCLLNWVLCLQCREIAEQDTMSAT